MSRDWKASTSYTLTSTQVEKMLSDAYGDKLRPVNEAKMAKQRHNQARQHEKQVEAQSNADNQQTDDPNEPGI